MKFIHVLKRVQTIDAEITELRQLQAGLVNTRSYTESLRISIEQQVNNLLNERVKLMEVRIENPPETFLKDSVSAAAFLKDRPHFKLEELSTQVSTSAADFTYKNPVRQQITETPITEKEEQKQRTTLKSEAERMSLKEIFKDRQEPTRSIKPKTRAELIKDLPPLEY